MKLIKVKEEPEDFKLKRAKNVINNINPTEMRRMLKRISDIYTNGTQVIKGCEDCGKIFLTNKSFEDHVTSAHNYSKKQIRAKTRNQTGTDESIHEHWPDNFLVLSDDEDEDKEEFSQDYFQQKTEWNGTDPFKVVAWLKG